AIASSADARTSSVNWVSPAPTIPPVSQSLKVFPPISHLAEIRSRVIPGWPCTMAMRRPATRLNNADFPTFGRPAMPMFIGLLYQRNDEARMTKHEGMTKHRFYSLLATPLLRYSITPLLHCALPVSAWRGRDLRSAVD